MALVPDLSIVIPAYNEEQRLERTVRDAVAYFRADGRAFELIVVDDGSRDHTSALVRRLSDELPEVRLIRLAANHGKGYAVRTGVVNAPRPDGAVRRRRRRHAVRRDRAAGVGAGGRRRGRGRLARAARRAACGCRPSSTGG